MAAKKIEKKKNLPEFFAPILWSYDFSEIEPGKNKRVIIVNTVNYGDLKHWRWIAHFYGESEVVKVLSEIPATAIRPGARRLAGVIFKIKEFNYAPRGAGRSK